MITVESLEKQLNQKQLQPIYLFYGDEKYLIETNVKKIKNIFGECIKDINYILIDETNIKEPNSRKINCQNAENVFAKMPKSRYTFG